MWQVREIFNEWSNSPVTLINDSSFQGAEGDLDYLHLVRQPSYFNLQIARSDVNSLAQSEQKYNTYLPELVKNFKVYWKDNEALFPTAVVRPPTRRPRLQNPTFEAFRQLTPIIDLSECLIGNPMGEKLKKFSLSGRRTEELAKTESILIIDDVYAEGYAVASVISNLGRQKKYIVICPLIVERDAERDQAGDLIAVTRRMFGGSI